MIRRRWRAALVLAAAVFSSSIGSVIGDLDGGDSGAAVVEECRRGFGLCQRELEECLSAEAACRATAHPPPRKEPDWPEGFGKLLRFPFGMSDMKQLKEFARMIWQPDGTAATISTEITDRGFVRHLGSRCTSEQQGVHPIGGPGERWTAQLWEDAQDWCVAQDNCTGIMVFVGKHTLNCHHWCARPQFCDGPIDSEGGIEPSADWNLFALGPRPESRCGGDAECLAAERSA